MIEQERCKIIRNWLIDNIFRDDVVMFDDNTVITNDHDINVDLIEVISSLYEELHRLVYGEPYDYMFHWANKVGSWCGSDWFDKIIEGEKNGKTDILEP